MEFFVWKISNQEYPKNECLKYQKYVEMYVYLLAKLYFINSCKKWQSLTTDDTHHYEQSND